MNQTSDLDRLLGDWLADGPNRAPDQPISAATQFARAHPRRPDPLRIFRSDPMADRRRSPFGLQPGLVFALLALVVAIVAAGVIGSRLERPVVVPPSNGQPAPSRPAQESPSSTPIASEPPSPFATVALNANGGRPATVDIFDLSGLVVDARSGPAVDGVSIDGIVVTNDKADSIVVTWDGSPCDTAHRLTVDATATHLVLERPKCTGDSIGRQLSLVLKFSRSVVASDVQATVVDGQGGGGLPNWTLSGPDTGGNVFHAQIFDGSGTLVSAESTSQGGGGTRLPPDTGLVENLTPTTIKLTWARRPCATDEQLMINEGVTVLTMIAGDCGTGTGALDREMTLEFSQPVDASGLTPDVQAPSPGPS
jgi:hypothetical protein